MKICKKTLPVLLTIVFSVMNILGILQVTASEENFPFEEIALEEVSVETDFVEEDCEITILDDDIEAEETTTTDLEEMADQEISAMEEEDLSLFSMMPLKEENVYLTLNSLSDDLTAFPVSELLRRLKYADGSDVNIQITPDTCIVWNYSFDNVGKIIFDSYHTVSQADTIDLSMIEDYGIENKIDMLVGSGEQLDLNMSRYFINISFSAESREKLQFELWSEDAFGQRTKVCGSAVQKILDTSLNENYDIPAQMVATFENVRLDFDQYHYYLGIKSTLAKESNYALYVSNGRAFIDFGKVGPEGDMFRWIFGGEGAEEPYEPLGVNCDMSIPGAGILFEMIDITTGQEVEKSIYKAVNGIAFYLNMRYVYMDSGDVIQRVQARVGEADGWLGTGYRGSQGNQSAYSIDIYQYQNDIKTTVAYLVKEEDKGHPQGTGMVWRDDNLAFTLQTNNKFNPDEPCYMKLVYTHPYPVVNKGYDLYEGKYTSIEEAQLNGNNINHKEDYLLNYSYYGSLLENNEYTLVNHSGEEVLINIEIDLIGEVKEGKYYFSEETESPIIGAKDPYFQITGIKLDDRILDTYVIENGKAINMDTYYGYGYQTVLVNEKLTSEEMARLQPVFSTGDYSNTRVREETGTQDIVSGVTKVDFGNVNEPVHLIASLSDSEGHERAKNYYVRVVSKSSGPKLYVYDGWQQQNEEGSYSNVREVMLDEYFEEKHDILIANVGDEPLTGIQVQYVGTGAKLDDYWNIHANGYNTLNPFSQTKDHSEYGYIDSIAKIRLLPDGTGDLIEGYVIISADNQEDVKIYISNQPKQPMIVTEQHWDMVKYIPFSFFISTNNMYDWNTQKFHVSKGKLPEGMELDPDTGEIYGAPWKVGIYTFSVQADFGSDKLQSCEKEFFISVADNEDAVVFQKSDVGYSIIPIEDGVVGYVGLPESEFHFIYTSSEEDEIYISEGPVSQFVKLWLNGEVLTPGVDYTYEEGSTKTTIPAQVMEDRVVDGRNTIAAEFNVEGKGGERGINLKRTAQNFYFYPNFFSVVFYSNGHGITPQIQSVREGRNVLNPGILSAEGYDFKGWYQDPDLTQLYDFSVPIKNSVQLYAKWEKKPVEPTTQEPEKRKETDPVERPQNEKNTSREEQPGNKPDNVPQTGDPSSGWFWMILGGLAFTALIISAAILKRTRSR